MAYVDLGTHGMFICFVAEARVINKKDTMTYTYYQENVKQSPRLKAKRLCAPYAATSTKAMYSRMISSAALQTRRGGLRTD